MYFLCDSCTSWYLLDKNIMNKAADFLAAVSVQVKLQVQLLVCLILQIFEQCVICD